MRCCDNVLDSTLLVIHLWSLRNYQVVSGTCQGGSFEKETWLLGTHGELEGNELK